MFVFASLSSVAACAMSRPATLSAIVAILAAVLSLVLLSVVALWNRRPVPVVVVCFCCCYLCIADGGLFPTIERYLPTEWVLSQCSTSGTVFDSGRKRSDSLAVWTSRLCLEDNHKDWESVPSTAATRTISSSSTPDDDQRISGVTVKLPTFAMTTANTVVIVSNRDDPQNRAFFIIGHCICVIVVAMLTMTAQLSSSLALFAGHPARDARYASRSDGLSRPVALSDTGDN